MEGSGLAKTVLVKELKVYVSENMHAAIQRELGSCHCSMTGFVRTAIARELIERSKRRVKLAKEQPLEGQIVLDEAL